MASRNDKDKNEKEKLAQTDITKEEHSNENKVVISEKEGISNKDEIINSIRGNKAKLSSRKDASAIKEAIVESKPKNESLEEESNQF